MAADSCDTRQHAHRGHSTGLLVHRHVATTLKCRFVWRGAGRACAAGANVEHHHHPHLCACPWFGPQPCMLLAPAQQLLPARANSCSCAPGHRRPLFTRQPPARGQFPAHLCMHIHTHTHARAYAHTHARQASSPAPAPLPSTSANPTPLHDCARSRHRSPCMRQIRRSLAAAALSSHRRFRNDSNLVEEVRTRASSVGQRAQGYVRTGTGPLISALEPSARLQ